MLQLLQAIAIILSIVSVQGAVDIVPRKLTQQEIQTNSKLPLGSLFSSVKQNSSVQSPANIKLKHVAKGTNKERGWKDAVRMPGTNWCGKGWRADSARSMGGYSGADRCCRQHDLGCPISLEPGKTEYGLTNVRFHTVMHCDCDERFSSCLKMARTRAADIVGNLFFNVAHIPCFVFSKQKVRKQILILQSCSLVSDLCRSALPGTGGEGVLTLRRDSQLSGGNRCRIITTNNF